MKPESFHPDIVLDLWFPDTGHQNDPDAHAAFFNERMQGGMDDTIINNFGDLTHAAATGRLDHWAETPRGRLALLIALDQFPRSLWRDTPAAFGQDIKAARLALEGIENGDIDVLQPWETAFFIIAITHCEGPDHLDRIDRLYAVIEDISKLLPEPISHMGPAFVGQQDKARQIIKKYGRHPHRNEVLGRISTPSEEAYIAIGDFPHVNDGP